MNPRANFFIPWRPALAGLILAGSSLVTPADSVDPAAASSTTNRSVFIQPSSPKEGRDPFFPFSTRPYASVVVPNANTKDLSSLVMSGMSGTPEHPLVIINKITFAVGDEREVITSQGRIRIHCLEIVGDMVVIEANGQRHQLRYGSKP